MFIVDGILKGFDQLSNLVLDDTRESISGTPLYIICSYSMNIDESCLKGGKYRSLGLTVIKGTQIIMLSPIDDINEISNPFM